MASTASFKNVPRPIKTYTRPIKPKEETISFLGGELPVEYDGACRLCLERSGNMTKIFNESDSIIPLKIRSILTIEVDEDDQLPSIICETCLSLLNDTYSFKKRSIANDVKLRQYLRKSTVAVSKPSLFEDSSCVNNLHSSSCDDDDNMFSMEVEKEECTVEWDEQNPLVGVIESLQPEQTHSSPVHSCQETEDSELPETQTFATLEPLQPDDNEGEYIIPDHTYDRGQENSSAEKVLQEQERRLGPYERVELVSDDEYYTDETSDDYDEDDGENIPLVERLLREQKRREPYFSCVKCKRQYETRVELNDHRKTCILKEICVMCPKSFVSRSLLLRHMRTHTGEKPFECDFCSATFSQKEILLRHIAVIHATVRPYKCKLCGKSFAICSLLAGHIRTSHDTNRKYTCHLCGKEFNHCSGLSRHRASHEDIYYCCKICKRRFTDLSSVKRHVKLCHWEVLAKEGFSKPTDSNNSVSESEMQSQNEFTLTLIEKRTDVTEEDVDDPDGVSSSSPASKVINGQALKKSTPGGKGGTKKVTVSKPAKTTCPKRPRGRPRKSVEPSTTETPKSDLSANQSGSLGKELDDSDSIDQTQTVRNSQLKRKASSGRPEGGEEDPIQDESSSAVNEELNSSNPIEKESPPVLKKPRGRPRKSVITNDIKPPKSDSTGSESNVSTMNSSEPEISSQPIDKLKNCKQQGEKSIPVIKRLRGRPRKSLLQAVTPTSKETNSSDRTSAEEPSSSTDLVGPKVALEDNDERNFQEPSDVVHDSSAKERVGNSKKTEKESSQVSVKPRGRPRKSPLETVKPVSKVSNSNEASTGTKNVVEESEPEIDSEVDDEAKTGNIKSVEKAIPFEQEYEELLAESEDASMAIIKTIDTLQSSLKSKVIIVRKSGKCLEEPKTDSVTQETN